MIRPVPERMATKTMPAAGGCLLWTAQIGTDGYGRIKVAGRPMRAHRVAYATAKGPIPAGALVLHSCDTPACVNPDHLSLGSNRDNCEDRVARGRSKSGGGGSAKLSAGDVRDLLEAHSRGESTNSIARRLGVDPSSVRYRIRNPAGRAAILPQTEKGS